MTMDSYRILMFFGIKKREQISPFSLGISFKSKGFQINQRKLYRVGLHRGKVHNVYIRYYIQIWLGNHGELNHREEPSEQVPILVLHNNLVYPEFLFDRHIGPMCKGYFHRLRSYYYSNRCYLLSQLPYTVS